MLYTKGVGLAFKILNVGSTFFFILSLRHLYRPTINPYSRRRGRMYMTNDKLLNTDVTYV